MAVTVVEKTGGSAANAEAVTVTFSDAVAGDLILFCYGTYLKTGEDDWLANSDWEQIFSAGPTSSWPAEVGMVFHIVQSGETSWNPVNDASNSVRGIWTAYRVQGHSIANPVLNYYFTAPVHGYGVLFPDTVPGANSVLGMMFSSAGIADGFSTALSGGVSGGNAWHVDTETDGSSNILCTAYVAAIDNITPATGSWTAGNNAGYVNQWVVQAAPESPTVAGANILKEEVVCSEFSGSTEPSVGFNISWTPTEGNYLLAIFCASGFFPSDDITSTENWTLLSADPSTGIVVALRTVQPGDGTAYTVSTTMGTIRADWYAYVYELTGTTYSGINTGDVETPYYITPFEGGTGSTLCFYAVTIGTDEDNAWPQYAVISGQTPDGSGCSSINGGGIDSKFVSAVGHQLTIGGGSGSTELSCTTNGGTGATIVFDVTSGPSQTCALGAASLNFRGNVSGLFYVKADLGSEVVPTLYVDSTLSIDNGTMSPSGQAIAQDGQWIDWLPDNGPLSITFPASTIWVVTSQAKGSPPSIPVYATSKTYPPWKQTCTD